MFGYMNPLCSCTKINAKQGCLLGCQLNCKDLECQLWLPQFVTRAQILHRASSQHDHPTNSAEEDVFIAVHPMPWLQQKHRLTFHLLSTSKINSGKQRLYYYRFNDFIKEGNIYQYLAKCSLREVGSRVASPWDRQRMPTNSCKSYIFILCVLLFLGHLPQPDTYILFSTSNIRQLERHLKSILHKVHCQKQQHRTYNRLRRIPPQLGSIIEFFKKLIQYLKSS